MGHSLTKPVWTKSDRLHHQVVIEPSSEFRKSRRQLFGEKRRNHAHYRENASYPQTEQVSYDRQPQDPGSNRASLRFPFAKKPDCAPKVPPKDRSHRTPVAQVIVHRPSHTYRAREYMQRQLLERYPESSAYRPSSPAPVHVPVAKRPPEIGGRFLQPQRTVALMDVGSRLVEKGKVAKQEWKESLRAERERRFDDVCREYAALKVETEQDTYKRMKKEQKRVVKRQHVYTV